jgi:spoIIIJ-associated protein
MREEVKRAVEEYFQGLLELLGEEAEIQLKRETERELFINLQGVQTFDGSDPKTLRALSYLVEISLRRRLGVGVKIHLDANGYKERRIAELKQLALKLAEEAVRRSKRIQLDPMETYERKAIHEALGSYEGVRTYSEGKGRGRHVIIEPTAKGAQTPSSGRGSTSR